MGRTIHGGCTGKYANSVQMIRHSKEDSANSHVANLIGSIKVYVKVVRGDHAESCFVCFFFETILKLLLH